MVITNKIYATCRYITSLYGHILILTCYRLRLKYWVVFGVIFVLDSIISVSLGRFGHFIRFLILMWYVNHLNNTLSILMASPLITKLPVPYYLFTTPFPIMLYFRLLLPQTNGSSTVYDNLIAPFFKSNKETLDKALNSVRLKYITIFQQSRAILRLLFIVEMRCDDC